jgi:hypothetical protein
MEEPVFASDATSELSTDSTVASVAASEPAATETQPVPAEASTPDETGDPFLLALENALRATQAAAGLNDELATAEADAAVKSVIKLAADATEEASRTRSEEPVAPGALSLPATTTTTVAKGNGNGNGVGTPGNSTPTTTTTSVPSDSEEDPPGDGDAAGDSGGSQEGSTSAGEPGTSGAGAPGPIILPIP